MLEDKKQSLHELKISLESKYDQEKQQLKEMHAHELEEIQGKTELAMLDK